MPERFKDKQEVERLRQALEDLECEFMRRTNELQLAHDKLKALLDSISHEVWFADTDENITMVNHAVLSGFGESACNGNVAEIVLKYDIYNIDGIPRPAAEAPLLLALKGDEVRNQEEIVRIPSSGELRFRQLNASPVKDASGNIIGAVMVTHDITAEKCREAMLRETKKRQAFLLELDAKLRPISDPVQIQAVVTAAAMDYFAADRCYFCEVEGGDLIVRGDTARGNLPSVAGVYPLGSLSSLVAGQPLIVSDVRTTQLVDEKLKQICLQLHAISCLDIPVVKDGKLAGILCIMHSTPRHWTSSEVELATEIAERTWAAAKRAYAEKALRESEDRYRQVVQRTSAVILHLDADGIIRFANKSALSFFEFTEDELIGKSALGTIIPEWDTNGHDQAALVAELTTNPALFQTNAHENITKTGKRYWMEWSNAAMYDEEGRLKGFLAVGFDATERKQAEELLRAANQQKSQFLAVLSHELRNPLAAICNGLAILKQTNSSDEQAERALAIIDRQSAHLRRLVDDLLDITRISQNKIILCRERLDLHEVLQQVVDDHQTLIQTSGLHLQLDLGHGPLLLNGDRTRLSQVFFNLLHNAVKFTPSGGKIRITAGLDVTGEQAEVHITDNGVGIPSEAIDHIFQQFTQVDCTPERRNDGLGLGLALVKDLVDLHGGHVWASSAGRGAGTEFTVRLPLDKSSTAVVVATAPLVSQPRRVLIIEDNHDLADTLCELLKLNDHTVAVAYSGAEGLDKARTFAPDVVLCDIGLPVMDGFEVAKHMRADARTKKTLLIALTGYAQPEDVERVIAAGFDMHLAKPVELSTLQNILAELPA